MLVSARAFRPVYTHSFSIGANLGSESQFRSKIPSASSGSPSLLSFISFCSRFRVGFEWVTWQCFIASPLRASGWSGPLRSPPVVHVLFNRRDQLTFNLAGHQ